MHGADASSSDALQVDTVPAAQRMRSTLQAFIELAAQGSLIVQPVAPHPLAIGRNAGHFHLGAELFLQVQGYTEFRMPHTHQRLDTMQALVMPPKLLHDERVFAGAQSAFANIVIYADSQVMTCHWAYEESPGKPGIFHLEQCRHTEAARIQGWLADAATAPASDITGTWDYQQRALVLTVMTAVRRLLDAPAASHAQEPLLLAKLRVLVQNQLGNADLKVASLAASLGCTADYLSHLYSRHTGSHLRGFIQNQRLARAARLLTESDASIKEVAWYCGFASASYFIRSFRQEFGMTPHNYRVAASAQPFRE